jgi:hypothetical protein
MIPIPSLACFLLAATLSNSVLMRLLGQHNEVTNSDKVYTSYLNFVEDFGNMHKR